MTLVTYQIFHHETKIKCKIKEFWSIGWKNNMGERERLWYKSRCRPCTSVRYYYVRIPKNRLKPRQNHFIESSLNKINNVDCNNQINTQYNFGKRIIEMQMICSQHETVFSHDIDYRKILSRSITIYYAKYYLYSHYADYRKIV